VQPRGALVLGVLASVASYAAILLKNRLRYDDTLDVFGIHGVSAIVGALALVAFVRDSWMAEAAIQAGGSWTMLEQLGVQAAGVGVTIAYTAALTLVLLVFVEKTIGLRLREQDEMRGMDYSEHGERGYGLLSPN
jgi:Amt family ammonium transporter